MLADLAQKTQSTTPAAKPSPERLHFEEHGWVKIRKSLDASQVQRYREAIDRAANGRLCKKTLKDGGLRVDRSILLDPAFIEFLTLPGILDRYNDIAGTAAVLKNSWLFRNEPNIEAGADQARKPGWHRGSSPKWAMHADEDCPGLHHFPYLNFFVYLSDVGPGNGGTMAMDGSHKVRGDYDQVKERCDPIEVEAQAGDIFLFTESLMHSGPSYFRQRRYCMVFTLVPSWYSNHQAAANPEWFYRNIENDDLRGVLGEWRGVISPHRFGLDTPYAYDFSKPRERPAGHYGIQ